MSPGFAYLADMLRASLSSLFLVAAVVAQTGPPALAPPKVVSMKPRDGGVLDPAATELVVTFDRDMFRGGYSVCGGGPDFPKIEGRPKWRGDRTLVIPVRLEPDHEYRLSLNCSSGRKIRSKEGARLTPTRWSFSTLPQKLRPWPEQQQRNRDALDRLRELLATRYAYRDRVVEDWGARLAARASRLEGARTDRAFAVAANELMKAASDQHVSLTYRDTTYTPYAPVVEPLFRTFAVQRTFALEKVTPRVFRGATDDGIGYLLVTGWQEDVDVERLLGAVAEMMAMKALVIDVRPNTGGDERLARRVASWFVEGERVYARHRAVGDGGLGEPVARTLVGNEERFTLPTALLVGPRVMSSCESFVLMMKQAPGVQVIGQKTRGSSGNPVAHDLGNGVSIRLPSWQALRPDGTCIEGEGVAPDVFVPCTSRDLETGEPTLEKALALLRQRIRAGR